MNIIDTLKNENKQLRTKNEETVKLLKQLKTQVGTVYGAIIDEHIASLESRRFNPMDWDMQDINNA